MATRTPKSNPSDTESVYSQSTVASSTFSAGSKGSSRLRRRRKRKRGRFNSIQAFDPITNQPITPRPLTSHRPSAYQRKRGFQKSATSGLHMHERSLMSISSSSHRRDSESTSTSIITGDVRSEVGPFSSTVDDSQFSGSESETMDNLQPPSPSGTSRYGDFYQIVSPIGGPLVEKDDEEIDGDDEDLKEDEDETEGIGIASLIVPKDVTLTLTETTSVLLFSNYQLCVSKHDEALDKVVENIVHFENAKKKREKSPHLFHEKFIQTLDVYQQNKYTDKPRKELCEQVSQAKEYEIFDAYEELAAQELARLREEEEMLSRSDKMEEDEGEGEGEEEENEGEEKKSNSSGEIFKNPKLLEQVDMVERMVVLNKTQNVLEEFTQEDCDLPLDGEVKKTIFDEKKVELREIWKFDNLLRNHSVANINFNRHAKNIMGACYRRGEEEGRILCWNLKNILHPEHTFYIDGKSPVCLSFSHDNPFLLAAGFNEGTVAVFDLRKRSQKPCLETSRSHQNTVWDVQFVKSVSQTSSTSTASISSNSNEEGLFSLGIDGRINVWSLKKGLDSIEINRLKRQTTENYKGILPREIGGLSFDFHRDDPRIYLAGTESGTVFKYSTSYNEQYLSCFEGHKGPVYRVKWNPLVPTKFITCSADWTVRIWNDEEYNPQNLLIEPYLYKEEKQTNCILDVDWSYHDENVFSFISITKEIEVWNLNYSVLKPWYSQTMDIAPSSIRFSPFCNSIYVGDDAGCVSVMKIKKLDENE